MIVSCVAFRPEKLEIGSLMRLDQVTTLLPSELFSYNIYTNSQEGEVQYTITLMVHYRPGYS